MKRLILIFACAAAALFGQTTNYPTALDTSVSLFVLSDNVQTTLSAAVTSGATTLPVTSSTGFLVNQIATICETITSTGKCTSYEHMFVTAVPDATSLTVTRAFAGTSAVAHARLKLVTILIDAAHQKVLKDAVIAIETALGPNPVTLKGAATYNWSQTVTQTVNAVSSNVITITCPAGLTTANANNGFYFHLSGGTGSPTAEDDLITATTCATAGSSGTITFTSVLARTGSWTAASSYGGAIEAAYAIGSTGGTVFYSPGTVINTAAATIPYSNVRFTCMGPIDACTVQMPNSGTFPSMFIATSINRVSFEGLKFDGNFINTLAAYQIGVNATTVSGLEVKDSHFVRWGFLGAPVFTGGGSGYYDSAALKCATCTQARIHHNRFQSNWVGDIVGSGNGADIHDNQHGTPLLTEVGTVANYWDTMAGGLASVSWSNSDAVQIHDNQTWGANRFWTSTWGIGNPILANKLTHSIISGNTVTGMTPLPGVCTISGTGVTCTQAIFNSSLDVGMGFECESTVGTISRITAVGSTTTATLTSGPGNQTGSRCRMAIAGDLIQSNGLTDFRIVNNVLTRGGDMGLDVNMYWDGNPANNVPAQRGVVSGNVVNDNQVCGINLALGQVNYVTFSGNVTMNNNRHGSVTAGGRGGFCLNPTPDNVLYYTQAYLNFIGNIVIDTASTQTYGFDVETASFAGGYIGLNQFSGNLWSGGTAFSNVPVDQSLPQLTVQPGGVVAGFLASSPGLPDTDATAGLITYTAAQMVERTLIRAPAGNVNDVTATAALLVARLGLGQAILGTHFDFTLQNTSGGANTVTITAGASVTLSGTMTIAQNFQRTLRCYVTNAAVGAETVTCYNQGSSAL